MADRDTELLFQRAGSLVCAIVADTIEGERQAYVGGTGIFVAPYLVLTARHVLIDLFKLTGQPEPKRRGNFETQQGIHLFQVNPFGDIEFSGWTADRSWQTSFHDLALVQVHPEDTKTGKIATTPASWLPWSVMPPPEGERVHLLGYPQTKAAYAGGDLRVGLMAVAGEGRVTKVHELRRDRGAYKAPCFEITTEVDHGFSGGGVFWNGDLCGLVWGGIMEGGTMVSSLWPVTKMGIDGIGPSTSVGVYLDNGTIPSPDWRAVRDRIAIVDDDMEGSSALLRPEETGK